MGPCTFLFFSELCVGSWYLKAAPLVCIQVVWVSYFAPVKKRYTMKRQRGTQQGRTKKKKKKEREISVMVFHRTISSNLNCLNGLGIHGEMPGLSKGSPSACPHNPQPALSSRVEDDGTKHLHDARKQIKNKKLEGGL